MEKHVLIENSDLHFINFFIHRGQLEKQTKFNAFVILCPLATYTPNSVQFINVTALSVLNVVLFRSSQQALTSHVAVTCKNNAIKLVFAERDNLIRNLAGNVVSVKGIHFSRIKWRILNACAVSQFQISSLYRRHFSR